MIENDFFYFSNISKHEKAQKKWQIFKEINKTPVPTTVQLDLNNKIIKGCHSLS